MAWLRSSQEIEGHWKLQSLCLLTGWDVDQAIGRLHRFWWWVQKYAEDGDLSRFTSPQIDMALRLPAGTNLLEILTATKWLDSAPYPRVHDWWDHNGAWLQSKYKHNSEKWESIKRCYKSATGMNRSLTVNEPVTNLKEDVTRGTKQDVLLRSRKKGKKANTQTDLLADTEPEKASTTPMHEPTMNGSLNGSGNSGGNSSRTTPTEPPSEELIEVKKFIHANLPDGADKPDLTAERESHTLATETDRYGENGMKAMWKIFTTADEESYVYAKGQHFGIREFLRQIQGGLVDHPRYAALKRQYREEIMRRYADERKMETITN